MIFHVRLISLPRQTSGLVEALTYEAGVSNLVVLPGTAQRLRGDAVQFDEAKIRSDAVYAPSFYVLLAIAGLIGAVGIDKGTRQPVLRGIPALLAGFSAAMVVTSALRAGDTLVRAHTEALFGARLGGRPLGCSSM